MKQKRNQICNCGSGKKYKLCCMTKVKAPISLKEICKLVKDSFAVHQTLEPNKFSEYSILNVSIVNNKIMLCEYITPFNNTLDIKIEIGGIISFMFSFLENDATFSEANHIDTFSVKSYDKKNNELIYCISSRANSANIIAGESLKWFKNAVFVENTQEHRLITAKQKISEIENSLRLLISKTMQNEFGSIWWNEKINKKIKEKASIVYESKYGENSSDGKILIEYTFLIQLRAIISNQFTLFRNYYPDKIKFENDMELLNNIRKDESHNRSIDNDDINELELIYFNLLNPITEIVPEACKNFLTENWKNRSVEIINEFFELYGNQKLLKPYTPDSIYQHSIDKIKLIDESLYKLKSIEVPIGMNNLHNDLLKIFRKKVEIYQEIISALKTSNNDIIQKLSRRNQELNTEMDQFVKKCTLMS